MESLPPLEIRAKNHDKCAAGNFGSTYLSGGSVAIWDDLRIEFRKMFHPVIQLQEEGYQWFILEVGGVGDKS